ESDCKRLPPAVFPDTAGSLDQNSSGTYCLEVGQQLSISLAQPTRQAMWSPIRTSDPKVLTPVNTEDVNLHLVGRGTFHGSARGRAELTASQDFVRGFWTVTVVVK
ncbi:hypothetical protein, partial [Kitasatospora sp. NPDC093558]|uniref:hypothetical protein n=1 Tax=Kitasatospora sp. NPDC093558 TaxID=3155201 RepID=UPI003441664F